MSAKQSHKSHGKHHKSHTRTTKEPNTSVSVRFEAGLFRAELDGVLFVGPTLEILGKTISNVTKKPVKTAFTMVIGEPDADN
jgi:hypothetical protein